MVVINYSRGKMPLMENVIKLLVTTKWGKYDFPLERFDIKLQGCCRVKRSKIVVGFSKNNQPPTSFAKRFD